MEKRTLCVLICVFLLCMFTACASTENAGERKSNKGSIHSELEVLEFDESVRVVDLIAKVQIVELIEEVAEPSPKTLFKAKIIDTIKSINGDVNETITILQNGNSQWTFNDNKLFPIGSEYILFLNEAVGLKEEDVYWIQGEETGMYLILDNGLLEKQSLRLSQLESIENKDLTMTNKKDSKRETQVIYADKFIEVINGILEKN